MNNAEYIDFLKETIEKTNRELRRVLAGLKEVEAGGRKYCDTLRECKELAIPTPNEIIGGGM